MKRLTLLLFLSTFPGIAYCAVAGLDTYVLKTLTDGRYFGGCMALLEADLDSAGLACPENWVSFSCTGDFTSVNAAERNFDMAQIGLVTGAQIRIYVDDSKRHNGACYGYRIQLAQPE